MSSCQRKYLASQNAESEREKESARATPKITTNAKTKRMIKNLNEENSQRHQHLGAMKINLFALSSDAVNSICRRTVPLHTSETLPIPKTMAQKVQQQKMGKNGDKRKRTETENSVRHFAPNQNEMDGCIRID